jgi:hypothetical protein
MAETDRPWSKYSSTPLVVSRCCSTQILVNLPNPFYDSTSLLTDHPHSLPAAMLTFTSLLYVEYYWVLTTYSTLLKRNYGYNDIQIGLCYL